MYYVIVTACLACTDKVQSFIASMRLVAWDQRIHAMYMTVL